MSFLFSLLLFLNTSYAQSADGSNQQPVILQAQNQKLAEQIVFVAQEELNHLDDHIHCVGCGHDHSAVGDKKLLSAVQNWVNGFNLFRFTVEQHRKYQSMYYSATQGRERILNAGYLFLMSHFLETGMNVFGLYNLAYGNRALGAIVVTVASSEVICIAVNSLSLMNFTQKSVTAARIWTTKISSKLVQKIGLQAAVQKYLEKIDRLDYLTENTSENVLLRDFSSEEGDSRGQEFSFYDDEKKPYLTLGVQNDENGSYISEVSILSESALSNHKKDVLKVIGKFNFSVRRGLLDVLFHRKRVNYIQSESLDADSTLIQVNKYSLLMKPKYRFHSETMQCEAIFF